MAWLGRIAGSFFSASNENILALSHIKFDFSLVKLEAPVEFNPLGIALSHKRKSEAEDGGSHRTARRLGALFEQAIPSTPTLVSAYGRRVSEIIQSPGINPEGLSNMHGPFQPFVGADATAMWAAATSGAAAISVYLLACLIAHAWDRQEAISIWVELVTERKKVICESFSRNNVISEASVYSTRQDIRREELDVWDASARSWLRSADEAKQREKDQAMLILKNVRLPYPPGRTTYEKIIRTWHQALSAMEDILQGKPQSILNGSVPLAIKSWHLYPDMIVLGHDIKRVQLNDPLLPKTGTCTIGLEEQTASDGDGTRWSLTLSHMTFYGDPKIVHYQEDFSRISNDQFLIAVFGSLLGAWRVHDSGILPATLWIQDLWLVLQNTDPNFEKSAAPIGLEWLRNLAKAAKMVSQAFYSNDARTIQLVKFAGRRGRGLLAHAEVEDLFTPFFGLSNSLAPIALAEEQDVECTIRYLRHSAAKSGLKDGEAIIVRLHKCDERAAHFIEVMTAIPMSSAMRKRDSEGHFKSSSRHHRWLISPALKNQNPLTCNYHSIKCRHLQNMLSHREEEVSDWIYESWAEFDTFDSFIWRANPFFYPNSYPFTHRVTELPSKSRVEGEFIKFSLLQQVQSLGIFVRADIFKTPEHPSAFKHVLTEVEYPKQGRENHLATISPARLHDYFALSSNVLGSAKDAPGISLLACQCSIPKPCIQSLYAAGIAYDLYSELSGATIAMALITSQKPLHQARWFTEVQNPYFRGSPPSRPWSRRSAFGCLVHLETGKVDISEESYQNVFAISVDNSIFVTSSLLTDPADEVPDWSL